MATGLDNPRLLSFSGRALYVAEAGVGGAGPCVEGPEGESCFGLSGAITRITHHGSRRVVTGLPSLASARGRRGDRPADVVVPAHRRGSKHDFAATIGLGNAPEVRDTFGAAGRALRHRGHGQPQGRDPSTSSATSRRTSRSATRTATAPTPTRPGLMRDGGSVVVTDSGGNDLLRVRRHRGIRTLAVFPNTDVPDPFAPGAVVPMQAVPTSVVRGPDDAYDISQLTGFPFPTGGSSIWRFVRGEEPTVYATGLTNVTDLAWHKGSLYAVAALRQPACLTEPPEALPTGSLVKVAPGAAPTPSRRVCPPRTAWPCVATRPT